ncbi:hypothetical protein DFH07DRAFT_763466 [Mycena maculata]|uniref:Uncharacterized protein n=1 Tax=Mycena maculata TaxID=230809 RepID=A0AAD7KFY8_9AGAR|nr:hypothetical protein DFH07DRAFT_763466 [Mycena maculata]
MPKQKKQTRHMQKMRDARGTAQKENIPLSPKSRAIETQKHRADAAEAENDKLKQDKKNSARRERRHKKKIADLKQKTKEAEDKLKKAIAYGEAQRQSDVSVKQNTAGHSRTSSSRQKITALSQLRGVLQLARQQNNRHKEALKRANGGSCSAKHLIRMRAKHGRAYKVELRAIARVLVSCGCKEGQVGDLMQDIARIFGVDLDRAMSWRTVRRAVLEGLVASQVQLGAEMKYTEEIDITMSSDSTSRRHLNYQSHHIHLRVPVKNADGTETSKAAWLTIYDDITAVYNASPLGQRLGNLNLRLICRRLRGMCGDHANNEKALSQAWKELKHDLLLAELGEQRLMELDGQINELQKISQQWVGRKFDDAGGFEAYMHLPAEERAARDLACVNAMTRELGAEALTKLDDADRHLLTVWVWTGCCMHKDQNSFKGGNTHMTTYWKELGVPGPIPLANKDSAAAVRCVLHPEDGDKPVSEDDLERLENAAFGGAKAAALAGAIFENTIEKHGQGDQVEVFLRAKLEAGAPVKRFAKTNQTRFGSHGDASCELIARREIYREFLEAIKDLKTRPGWTNIEKNVFNVLNDGPTLTELAVLSIYHLFVSVPYTRRVRAPEEVALNAISLGPLHAEVRDHCQKLIDSPELILDFDKDEYLLATFDGQPVVRDDVMVEIKRLYDNGKLPYLREMLKRGGLGSFIRHMREDVTAALATHNGRAMFGRNETQAFMDMWFTPKDHRYVMQAVRNLDAAGLERERKRLQMEYNQRILAEKAQKVADAAAKEAEIQQHLDSTTLISCVEDIYRRGMTREKLQDQLEKLRRRWNTKARENIVIPKKSHIPRLADKQRALVNAFQDHLKLLASASNQTTDFSAPQEEEELVQDHYHADDADFGEFEEDTAVF